MKFSKYSKITAYILIQVFFMLNFSWAAQDNFFENDSEHTLAPSLQINNNAFFLPCYNVDVVKPWDKVDVVLKEQKQTMDYFTNTIEVSFRYDQIGIFNRILNAIDKEGNLIWFEMVHKNDRKMFKFGVTTETKKQRSIIIDNIKKINDLPQKKLKKIRRNKWVLTLFASEKSDIIKNVTAYLADLDINVSKFLTPMMVEAGKSQFVFELDIPWDLRIDSLKSNLSLLNNGQTQNVQVTSGQLVDRVLDDFLIKEINMYISRDCRKELRLGLKTVAARHISQARKDRRTPFLMHPVEIAKIISNEIKMFTPELLIYFARSLKIKRDKVILLILMATLLHDAVEDGDIPQKMVLFKFGKLISEIVSMVTKQSQHRDKNGEKVYLNNLVIRKDIIGLIAQIIKIADRIHNLRTLKNNTPEFQRKIIFSTIDNFEPFFVSKINISEIKNKYMRGLYIRAIGLFNQQMLATLEDFNLIDENLQIDHKQRMLYEWEEECRLNPKVLSFAEKNNIIAHGVWGEKGGLNNLLGILKKGYIKAKPTKIGMVVFAGLLRPQRADEDYDDYQAESPGSYGPYYVILKPIVNNLRMRVEVEKRKVILPGYYQAMPLNHSAWGISSDLHAFYLVPANTDRQYLAANIRQAVQNREIDMRFALDAISKIITYDEFLAGKGSLKQRNISPLEKNNISFLISNLVEQSI